MRIKIAPVLVLSLALTAAACGKRGTEAGSSESKSKTPEPTLSVTDVDLGRTINADKSIADHTGDFKPKETIYVSVATAGTKGGTLKARWTAPDGKTIDETTEHISPNGPAHTEFHVTKPSGWPVGKYRVDVFLDDNAVGTKEFEVKR